MSPTPAASPFLGGASPTEQPTSESEVEAEELEPALVASDSDVEAESSRSYSRSVSRAVSSSPWRRDQQDRASSSATVLSERQRLNRSKRQAAVALDQAVAPWKTNKPKGASVRMHAKALAPREAREPASSSSRRRRSEPQLPRLLLLDTELHVPSEQESFGARRPIHPLFGSSNAFLIRMKRTRVMHHIPHMFQIACLLLRS